MGSRSTSSVPVYIQIADRLRQQIIDGVLNPGDILPSESKICEMYHVSRDTARKSLIQLENDGFIFSRPKVGYFVSTPKHENFSLSFFEQVPGCVTRYRDIHGILPDAHIQAALQIPPTRKVIEFSQITKDPSDTPVAYVVKYIPYERSYPSVESELRFAVFPDITFPRVTPYAYYTELTIQATAATEELAEILSCQVGDPLLLVERIFIQQNGNRIGFAQHYSCQPYALLRGTSGYVQQSSPSQEAP